MFGLYVKVSAVVVEWLRSYFDFHYAWPTFTY